MLERFIGLYAVDVGFVQTNIRRHGAMRRDLRRRSSGASRPTRWDAVDLPAAAALSSIATAYRAALMA